MIEERSLGARVVGGMMVLDVVGEGTDLRVFLGAGTDPARVGARGRTVPSGITSVNRSLMVRASWPGGPCAVLPVEGAELEVPVTAPEPDLLAGLRVMMGARNGETAELVHDWLRHHVETQGAEAALILDRTRPGEPPLAPMLRARLAERPIPGLRRAVVVTCDLPLGEAGASERHPSHAPDAPGKDRIPPPPDDPWTAPLREAIVWEALRWRILTRARAVAFLEVSDLLTPAPPGRRAFDLLERAEAGVVALLGRRIYPWRVRKGRAAGFGDHVYVPFDATSGNRRWACDPTRVPEDAPFRLVRIGALRPAPEDAAPFYRAVATRVPRPTGCRSPPGRAS